MKNPKPAKKRNWNWAIIGAAVLVGAALSARPWRVYGEQKARTAEYQKKMREAEQRRVDLTREKAQVQGPLGKEQAARELGFTKPGEIPVHPGP